MQTIGAWSLNWNDMTNEQRETIVAAAEYNSCDCYDNLGQTALDVFNAVIAVIEERDKAEIEATLST